MIWRYLRCHQKSRRVSTQSLADTITGLFICNQLLSCLCGKKWAKIDDSVYKRMISYIKGSKQYLNTSRHLIQYARHGSSLPCIAFTKGRRQKKKNQASYAKGRINATRMQLWLSISGLDIYYLILFQEDGQHAKVLGNLLDGLPAPFRYCWIFNQFRNPSWTCQDAMQSISGI